jgi:hypothetical protein
MTHAQRGGGAGQLKLKHFKGLLNQHLFHWSSTDMYIWGYSQHCEHFFKFSDLCNYVQSVACLRVVRLRLPI